MVAPDFDATPRRMPNDTGRRVAENLIGLPDQTAGSVFALRWTKFDVVARIVVLVAIALIPILTTWGLDSKLKGTEKRMKEHIDRTVRMAKSPGDFATPAAMAETSRHYGNIVELAQEYADEAQMLGKVQVAAMGLPVLLMVLMGIGEYWRFKAVMEMRKAMNFLRSPEGVDRLRREVGP